MNLSQSLIVIAQGCLDTTLRILVSLTHANELWARKVVQCEYAMGWLMRLVLVNGREMQKNWSKIEAEYPVKSEETEMLFSDDQVDTNASSTALDTLCLALGLLTNLVQIVPEAKRAVHDARMFFSFFYYQVRQIYIMIRSKSTMPFKEEDVCSTLQLSAALVRNRDSRTTLFSAANQNRITLARRTYQRFT